MQFGTPPTLLSRAPLRPYGLFGRFCYDPDPEHKGGDDPVKTAANKAVPTVPDLTGKLVLSQEELDAKVQAAINAHQKKADDKAKRDQEEADRKAAEEQGEFKKLAETAQTRAESAEAERDALKRERAVEKALLKAAGEHKEYPFDVFEKYVMPALLKQAEGDDFDAEKACKQAVADYVKDNPRAEKKGGTPAPLPRTGNRMGFGKDVVVKEKNNGQRPAFSGETSYL